MSKMPGSNRPQPVTTQQLIKKKAQGEKIISLTCYDYTTARLLEDTPVDFILVGDSLAMTVLGYPNTLSVTMDEMLHHVKAVRRGIQRSLLVADMPFLSYHVDQTSAIRNAGRFIQEGEAGAVKLEGASPMVVSIVHHLTSIGIPVMGHLGFTPQAIHQIGGFRVQGKTVEDAKKLLEDARLLQSVGVFAIVLEMVPLEVAEIITRELEIPTIGIGAGNVCDGQILVIDDFLGRYPDLSPKFVRPYEQAGKDLQKAVFAYARDIHSGHFPNNDIEAFHFPADQVNQLEELTGKRTQSPSR